MKKQTSMTRRTVLLHAALLLLIQAAWAQVTGNTSQETAQPQDRNLPAAAIGETATAPQQDTTQPVSSVQKPSLEVPFSGRSFLETGLQVSESISSNAAGANGVSAWTGVTYATASVGMRKIWRKSDFSLSYLGGGAFYTALPNNVSQSHQADLAQRFSWGKGQLGIRDSVSYLPQGAFGSGSFGGVGGTTGATGTSGVLTGPQNFFDPQQFASIGQSPRVTNTSMVDVTEYLSQRTSLTAAGAYTIVRFTDDNSGFLNSDQITGQLGYSYELNRRDQIGLIYGYQAFRFPGGTGTSFNDHIVNLLYEHQINGRMSFLIGGGPQLTRSTDSTLGRSNQVSGSGRASFLWRISKTSLNVGYDHYQTSGSGLFVGSTSDAATIGLSQTLGRKWTVNWTGGYSHNSSIQTSAAALPGRTFDYAYGGAILTRQLGPTLGLQISYQLNNQWLDQSSCGARRGCSTTTRQHMALIGLNWQLRPIRLD